MKMSMSMSLCGVLFCFLHAKLCRMTPRCTVLLSDYRVSSISISTKYSGNIIRSFCKCWVGNLYWNTYWPTRQNHEALSSRGEAWQVPVSDTDQKWPFDLIPIIDTWLKHWKVYPRIFSTSNILMLYTSITWRRTGRLGLPTSTRELDISMRDSVKD